ncbi:MAG TPA: NUDIX domain-containing protein [Candidatus Krumholzibacteria bacterium]
MKQSAGILMYRFEQGELRVLLVHPGGPFWARRDAGAWTIPKGEFDREDPLAAARREFLEEVGVEVSGELIALAPVRQKSGKIVHAWAVEGDLDADAAQCRTFVEISGRRFPEVDRAAWFSIPEAARRINPAQAAFLAELNEALRKRAQRG